jgi:hypothetical protein
MQCKVLHYTHQIFQLFLVLRKNHHIYTFEGSNPNNPAEVKYKWNPDGFAGSSYGYYNVPGQQLDAGPDAKGAIIYDN